MIGTFPAMTCSFSTLAEVELAAPTLPCPISSIVSVPALVALAAPDVSQATKLPSSRQTPHQYLVVAFWLAAIPVMPAMPVIRVSSPAWRCNSPRATLSASAAFWRAWV